jgi:hypothetical protein
MKITSLGFQKEVKTDFIQFSVLRGNVIDVESIKFKAIFFSNEPIEIIWIGTDELRVELSEWFRRMLRQKLILVEPSNVQDYFEEHLFVRNTEMPYVAKTIFQILEKLISPKLTLISLEYETNN